MDKQEDFQDLFANICSWPYHIHPDRQLFMTMMKGDPLPAPRPRVTARGTYMPDTYQAYREGLSWKLKIAFRECAPLIEPSPYGLRVFFFRRTRQRTDIDNLLKTCLDAGTKIIWKDDSEVQEVFGRILYDSDNPRMVMLLYKIDEPTTRATLICQQCEKPYRHMPAPSEKRLRKFCSNACKIEHYRAKHVTKVCEYCHQDFHVPVSLAKRHYSRFCSRRCNLMWWSKKRRANYSPKLCISCQKRVSRPEYTRCQGCQLASRKSPKSHYRWFHPVPATP